MMPLWTTAIRPDWSVCGWALAWWARRGWPSGCGRCRGCRAACRRSSCSRARDSLPAAFMILSPLPLTTAMPAGVVAAVLQARSPSMSSRRPGGVRCSRRCRTSRHASVQEFSSRGRPALRASPRSALRRSVGRSARCPRAARAASGPAQASRSPSRSSASASANRCRSRSYSGPSSGPRGPFALTIVYRGDAATSSDTVTPVAARRCKIKATPRGASRPMCSAGKHHPAVALAADHGALVPHGPGHVGLAHRRADEPGARRPGRILHHQAGGEVHHHRRDVSPPVLRPSNTASTANASV